MIGRYLHDHAGMAYSIAARARIMAQGSVIARQLILHSTMLAYLDVIQVLCDCYGYLMIPFVFLMKKVKGGRGGGGALTVDFPRPLSVPGKVCVA